MLTFKEFKTLAEAYTSGHLWIARDKSGWLFVFKYAIKPQKDITIWRHAEITYDPRSYTAINHELCPFIHWKDDEPYEIAKLLNEYVDAHQPYFDAVAKSFTEQQRAKYSTYNGRWKGVGMGDYMCSYCSHVTSTPTSPCPNCNKPMDPVKE